MSLKEGYKKSSKVVFKAPIREKKSVVVNGIDLLENVPPRTENEVRVQGLPYHSGRASPLCCHCELQAWKPALSQDIVLSVTHSVRNIASGLNEHRGWSIREICPSPNLKFTDAGVEHHPSESTAQCCGRCKPPRGSSLLSSSQPALPSRLLVCHISCLRGRG